jgi:uncharacterized protein (UPF0216 family)|tara:strand:+ start:734 stop:1039 length:306 start_codon:yes stop_codon:yes gene_type:complete
MAVKAGKKKIVVDEMAKFDKGEIEFLFEMIKEAMIPGKYLPIAMATVQKLKNQYKLADKKDFIIKKEMSAEKALKLEVEKVQRETIKKIKREDNELWIEDD